MSGLAQDLRFAWRQIARRPAWSAAVVLVLALGIAGNVAMFAGFDAWVLRELDLERPEELVILNELRPTLRSGLYSPRARNYGDWRERQSSFAEMAAFERRVFNVDDEIEPTRVQGAAVSHRLFPLLGAEPAVGRRLLPEEDVAAQPAAVALIGHRLWSERFAGDREVAGRTLRIDGREHQIVGVMEAGFEFPEWAQVWTPLGADLQGPTADDSWLSVVARLKPEIAISQAGEDLARIARELGRERPETNEGWSVAVRPLRDEWVPEVIEVALTASLIAAILVLLIICANVASLMLVKTENAARETAIRAALGSDRWRLIRPLLIESLVLAAAAGVVGVWLSTLWVRAMLGRVPLDPPYLFAMRFDHRTALFTLALCVLAAVACALVPMTRSSKVRSAEVLHGGRSLSSRRSAWIRGSLVTAELALSTALAVAALLMVKSFALQRGGDLGYRTESVLTADVTLTGPDFEETATRLALVERIEQAVGSLVGVTAGGVTTSLPASDRSATALFEAEGRPAERGEGVSASLHGITARYFETLEIPLLAGRTFRPGEVLDGADVAVIGEGLAARLWPDGAAVGRRLRVAGNDEAVWLQVVGVVGDVDPGSDFVNQDRPRRQLYRPLASLPLPHLSVALHTTAPAESVAGELREAVWSEGRRIPISEVLTLAQAIDRVQWVTRFFTEQLALYGLMAILIATFGLYGLVADSVAQRRREIALRMALGAQRGDVLQQVLWRELSRVALGIALGMAMALAVTRFGSTMLMGVSARDPVIFGGVALLLAGTAFAASLLPARRGTAVDPVVALRAD